MAEDAQLPQKHVGTRECVTSPSVLIPVLTPEGSTITASAAKGGLLLTVIVTVAGAWLLANVFANAPGWAVLSLVAAVVAFAWWYHEGSSVRRKWTTVAILVCALAVGTAVVAVFLAGQSYLLMPVHTADARHRVQVVYEGQDWTLTELLDVDLATLVEAPAERPELVEKWVETLQAALPGWKVSDRQHDSVRFRHERQPIPARVAWWRTHAIHELELSLPTLPLADDAFLQFVAADDSHVRMVSPRWTVVDTYPRATDEGISGTDGQEVRRIPLPTLYEDQHYGGEVSPVTVTIAGPFLRHGPGSRAVSALRTDGWAALLAVGVPVLLVRRISKLVGGLLDDVGKGWLERLWHRFRRTRRPPPAHSDASDPPAEPSAPKEPPGSDSGASPVGK